VSVLVPTVVTNGHPVVVAVVDWDTRIALLLCPALPTLLLLVQKVLRFPMLMTQPGGAEIVTL
jgi:hypothetical protein